MSANSLAQSVCTSLTPEKQANIAEKTNAVLLKLIRTNYTSKYVSQTSSFDKFRDAVSTRGGLENDTGALIQDFRALVPISDYQTYKPFMARFDSRPCKESEVENLFAPGIPSSLLTSSATSGTKPKLLPRYTQVRAMELPTHVRYYNSGNPRPVAAVLYCGYKEIVEVEREPGLVVQRIPIFNAVGNVMRAWHGWAVDGDEDRMSVKVPGYVAPWSATMIAHHRSFLKIHGLFFLACRDVGTLVIMFLPVFIDLIQNIDDQWDTFLDCIRDGTIPDLEGIEHVRYYLQFHFHPDPDRAEELRTIGRPFSREAWATHVWPHLTVVVGTCTGPFATAIPKARSILGPNVKIVCAQYAATEGVIGTPYRGDNDTFIAENVDGKILEFLDVTLEESHENISQFWEVKPGNKYEVIMTTKDGLWRYRLGDVVEVAGFDTETGLPLLHYSGRKSSIIRLPYAQITDAQLLEAVWAVNSKDVFQVQEFTTVLDDRQAPQTVGFFIELSMPLGPNAHLAPQKLFDALIKTNSYHERALKVGRVRLPTVRILKAGTFAEYRRWRSERVGSAGSSQIKVPVVNLDPAVEEWILDWVREEL